MISKEQIEAAECGKPVEVKLHQTDFVLIRKDVYERVKTVFDPSVEESYEAVEKAWGEETDEYQDYK